MQTLNGGGSSTSLAHIRPPTLVSTICSTEHLKGDVQVKKRAQSKDKSKQGPA
jgi:hypothetical protein